MKYKIEFKRSAFKEYEKLPKAVRTRVDDALEMLCVNPLSDILSFKKLRAVENTYRIRVGDYRIVYSPQNESLVVFVIKVGHRKDVYEFF